MVDENACGVLELWFVLVLVRGLGVVVTDDAECLV